MGKKTQQEQWSVRSSNDQPTKKKKNKEKNDDDDEKISMFRLVDFKLNLCGIVLKIMLEIFVEYGMKFLDQPVQLRKEKKNQLWLFMPYLYNHGSFSFIK